MDKVLISLLLFVSSATARGRGSIGLVSGSNTGWDAPTDKTIAQGVQVLCLLISLVQLIICLRNLGKIPWAARGPYILLAFVTFSLLAYYALDEAYPGADSAAFGSASKLVTASSFFYYIHFTFRPVVVLYLLHQRGAVLRVVKADTIIPLSTYLWKRILDWVLAGIAWGIYLGVWGFNLARLRSYYNLDFNNWEKLLPVSQRVGQGLGQTGLGFVTLLIINLVVSTIVQSMQSNGTMGDLVTSRLVKIVVPLFILYGSQSLAFDILSMANIYNGRTYGFNLANVIAEGVLAVGITGTLLLTMKIPGVQWTPKTAIPEVVPSHWAAANPPQQSQFYSTPHPISSQMQNQQQQYPYSSAPQQTYPLPATLPDVY